MKKLLIISLILTCVGKAHSQFDDVIYDQEFTYGITANTNVLLAGLNFRFSRIINDRVNHHIGLGIHNIKHPKEERYTNNFGNTFIYNKQYYVFPFRFNYGREYILFRKTPYEGMQMSFNFAAGPTFALVKPYYVLYDKGDIQVVEPYDPEVHTVETNILDGGRMFRGLDRGRFEPGAHMRGSIAFEFGKVGNDVAGLELGILMEGYARNIQILPFASNSPFFTSGFLTFFYGSRK